MAARPRTGAAVRTPDQLLSDYPPAIRTLAQQLRRLVRDTAPAANERVYPGWRALGFHDPEAGYFCGIFPFQDHVRFLFEHGAALEDPDGILTGHTQQVRWVEVRSARDIRARVLRAMILRALLHGATR